MVKVWWESIEVVVVGGWGGSWWISLFFQPPDFVILTLPPTPLDKHTWPFNLIFGILNLHLKHFWKAPPGLHQGARVRRRQRRASEIQLAEETKKKAEETKMENWNFDLKKAKCFDKLADKTSEARAHGVDDTSKSGDGKLNPICTTLAQLECSVFY